MVPCKLASLKCIYLSVIIVALIAVSVTNSTLVWSDEFNSEIRARPSEEWNYFIGNGSEYGNPGWDFSELQHYTDSDDNVVQDGRGHLVITAQRKTLPKDNCSFEDCLYTSGSVFTKLAWKYGRFETRLKPPTGRGLSSVFSLLGSSFSAVGWPKCGEISVVRFGGSWPAVVNFGSRDDSSDDTSSSYVLPANGSFGDDFHVFSAEWLPGSITWSVDGTTYHRANVSQTFDQPFFIRLNLAIGDDDGNPGLEDAFPQQLLVDYVRVYGSNDTLSIPTETTSSANGSVPPNATVMTSSVTPSSACTRHIQWFLILTASVMSILVPVLQYNDYCRLVALF